MFSFFDTKIEFLKGVGPQKAALINKELNIFTFGELIQHYPFRYEDRTQFFKINELTEDLEHVQIVAKIRSAETIGEGQRKRLVATIFDETGEMELTWFKGIQYVVKKLVPGIPFVFFGKPNKYGRKFSIAHPEMEALSAAQEEKSFFQPVYPTTEKLRSRFLDSKGISKIMEGLVTAAFPQIQETLPGEVLQRFNLIPKKDAVKEIHFPENPEVLKRAIFRLKFEEFFFMQLRLLKLKLTRTEKSQGQILNQTELLNVFYKEHIPFELTEAQKRVVREAYADMKSGKQMNRLIQGDVGSGKTMVAFICILIAISSGAQACLMAPTEILANQHYAGLKEYADLMGLNIALLTGSTKKSARKVIHESLLSGELPILIGTHALLEDIVQFRNLGMAIVDEQHRFGVAQRAKLWAKNPRFIPHVLVMTATPIPRTLAMTLYGDLEISVIDELPVGRKPIQTVHRYDKDRLKVFGFIRKQILEGRQVYIVYPLIEESETLDLKNLMDGFESICRAFPEFPVSIVHGKMKPQDKNFEMQRFVKGETKIMVATTVIEVGVNVQNASVMVIENAERFGLSQLHQLRGRVGRGADQSYCLLMTKYELSKDSRIRLETMVRTNNGFEIADVDLKLRGPGDLMGTQQSGLMDLLIADLSKDAPILTMARDAAQLLLQEDPDLSQPRSAMVLRQIRSQKKHEINWSRIS
ncbi:ATP-dependent DNA helicase RecG [Rhodonellum psychrophilum GCM71 = DSM 17998]|uniref:ATP-dependent DNA helicase RecG n=2 Tax=Rhodonellum TaxID=336827 RepID=U5BQP9_9BACT|nr:MULTISPECIES: ATP-dependent DNA helicase RecG [Rhodonellum]ERM82900.1 ATP-dependent DNA helicase RecG [Rhodonellum psychrophilum GCM71 = DSM 17998]SDY47559.1 ATP-dependent DNA helicase RecG [Rhodonellum ikkaensis]